MSVLERGERIIASRNQVMKERVKESLEFNPAIL
jgi:hypothetical protein